MVLRFVFGFNSLPPHFKYQFLAIFLPKTCNVSLSIPSTPISLSTKEKNPNRLGLVTALTFCEFLQLCNANLIFYKQLGREFSGSKNHRVNFDFFLPSHHHFPLVLSVRRVISHLKDLQVHYYLQTPFVQQRWCQSDFRNKTPEQMRSTEHTLRSVSYKPWAWFQPVKQLIFWNLRCCFMNLYALIFFSPSKTIFLHSKVEDVILVPLKT